MRSASGMTEDFKQLVSDNSDISGFVEKYPPSNFGLTEDQGLEYLEKILSAVASTHSLVSKEKVC